MDRQLWPCSRHFKLAAGRSTKCGCQFCSAVTHAIQDSQGSSIFDTQQFLLMASRHCWPTTCAAPSRWQCGCTVLMQLRKAVACTRVIPNPQLQRHLVNQALHTCVCEIYLDGAVGIEMQLIGSPAYVLHVVHRVSPSHRYVSPRPQLEVVKHTVSNGQNRSIYCNNLLLQHFLVANARLSFVSLVLQFQP